MFRFKNSLLCNYFMDLGHLRLTAPPPLHFPLCHDIQVVGPYLRLNPVCLTVLAVLAAKLWDYI